MRICNRLTLLLIPVGIVLAILIGGSRCAVAEDVAPAVRHRFVPADHPELWPDAATMDWVPVKRSELDQLIQQVRSLRSEQRTIPFNKATYSATFDPASLTLKQGTATLRCSSNLTAGSTVACVPLNLSIGEPVWEVNRAPAIFGAVPTGEHFLVIADDSRSLQFDWQLTGLQRLSGVEFLLRVPAAVASTLTLQVPQGWSLTASAGTVTRSRVTGGPLAWQVDLGRRTETRLRLIEPGQSASSQQNEPTAVSLNSRFEITPLVVEASTEVSFESLAANARSLDLQLAEAWQIRSVERSSGGSVTWQDLGPTGGLRRLRIEIPVGATAADRGFAVNASLPVQRGAKLQLAAPRLSDAVLFDGRLLVSLGPPFTLQEYATVGLGQTDVSVESGNGGRTVMTFQQFAADAYVSLSLRDDASSRARLVSIREFSVGRFDLNPPEFQADLQVTARSREVFSLEAFVPAGWELTRVTHRVAAGLQIDLPWRVLRSQADGPGRLLISLPDGVETGRPALLQISAQHVHWSRETTPTLPALFPDINALTSITTALVSPAGESAASPRIDGFEPVERAVTLPRFAWAPSASGLENLIASLHTVDYWENAEHLAALTVRWPVASELSSETKGEPAGASSVQHAAGQKQPVTTTAGNSSSATASADNSVQMQQRSGAVSSEPLRSVVKTRLESFVAPGYDGRDLHRMSWQFAYAVPARSISLQLPEGAVLLETLWNSQTLGATVNGDRWTVPVPETAAGDTLSVNYTLKARDIYLRDTIRVGVPEFNAINASFEWILHLRKGYAAVSLSEEMTRLDTARSAGWLRWFFGPLARGSASDWFNPFRLDDWRGVLRQEAPTAAADNLQNADAEPGRAAGIRLRRDWNTVQSVSGVVPKSLSIHVCRVDRLNALGWFVLVTSCLIGVLLRTFRVSSRNRIGLIWLSGCLAAAMLVPDRYAELVGAAILGTVIATLLPRSLVRPERKADDDLSYPPMSSTIALPRGKVTGLATLLIAGAVAVFAARAVAQNTPAALPDQIDILLPYPGERFDPRAEPPTVVYVNASVLQALQQTATAAPDPPKVLVAQSVWDGIIDRNSHSSVQGRLTVAIAKTAGPVIDVPVPASLVDPESNVLLDGQPVRTLPGFDGGSLLVPNPAHRQQADPTDSPDPEQLDRSATPENNRPGSPPLPETATVDPAQMTSERQAAEIRPDTGADSTWSLHTIEFRLRPEIRASQERRQFELPVTPVSRCGFKLKFEVPPAVVRSVNGRSIKLQKDGTITLQPGAVSRIGLDWPTGAASSAPITVRADVRSSAEIYTGRILRQTLARYVPADGTSVSQVAWKLPHQIRLDRQQIRAARLVDVSIQPQPDHTLVTLEFEPPHTAAFNVMMNWQQISNDATGSPVIQWEGPVSPQRVPTKLTVSSHVAGLKAAPGFSLSNQLVQLSEQSRVSSDSFLDLWPDNERPRSPQIALRIPDRDRTALPAEIVPMQVQRAVRQNLDARIGPALIRWTLSAEIETSNAPAFLHELIIPEKIRIDSVSLQRDEVDRLSHWERRDDRLFLFLRDRSTGIQNVTIEGRQRFDQQKPIAVPTVSVVGSQLLANTLQVYSQPGIRAIVHGAEAIGSVPVTNVADATAANGYSGQFRLIENNRANIELQTVRDEHPLKWLGILDLSPEGQLTLELAIGVSTTMPRDWTIELPEWIADDAAILEIDGMDNVSSSESLSAELDGHLLRLTVAAPAPEPSRLRVRLPVKPSLLDATVLGQPLRLTPPVCNELAQIPAAIYSRQGAQRLEITGQLISDAHQQQLANLFDAAVEPVGVLQWDTSTAASIEPATASILPAIVLHSVRTGGQVAQICRTRILLGSDVASLQIRWPASIQPVYGRIDGQLQPSDSGTSRPDNVQTSAGDRVERIELPPQNAVHYLEFLWQPAPVSDSLKIRRETVSFPVVKLNEPIGQFVEIIPAAGVNILPNQATTSVKGNRVALLEQLGPWQRYADGSSSLLPGARQALAALLATSQAASLLHDVILANSDDSADDLATSSEPVPSPKATVTGESLLLRTTPQGDVTVWLIDRHLDLVLLCILVGLAVVVPILKFFSLEFGERLAEKPALSLLLLGGVWWCCLQGSAVGFGLLLAALAWRAAQFVVPRRFRRQLRITPTQ
ncbi:hypothetical protein GC176_04980 [bacterium]|nr:hypothetical protein [bacterium]